MKKPITTAALITAAMVGGTLYAVQDPPECEAGEHFMMVVEVNNEGECTRLPVVTVCGEPLALAWTIDDEARPIDCGALQEGEVRRVDTAEAYPDSYVGYVGRHEVEHDDITVPAVEPHWGVCIGQGCYCAGECEHLPIGGPRDYWLTRLCRLHPEDPRCE